jgi:hypothetical protein
MAKGKRDETYEDYEDQLTDTLTWINQGDGLLEKWRELRGVGAERMVESLRKRLKKLRKQSDELWDRTQKEKKLPKVDEEKVKTQRLAEVRNIGLQRSSSRPDTLCLDADVGRTSAPP